ncbi:hypothetical protein BT63DRAFT_41268 [Microthyrium microscopicum]|uniref:ARM repeat-containing protein n=1 Tax=Microthyrium microscopicum TaxID=703497 RepID=A0A6A6UWV0_9PEZI|nr:hypothetical protein BT63DRAFT_41268 [Microthyrium microscopicum]
MDARNKAFQKLKPPCVALSQAALASMGSNGDSATVVPGLSNLLKVLKHPSVLEALDEKLADYVFFPLSSVLRQLEKVSFKAQELTFECISLLLDTAWKRDIAPELGIQLMILLTFLLDAKKEGAPTRLDLEELYVTALKCLSKIYQSLGSSSRGKNALTSAPHVPQIGKTLTVMLENVTDSSLPSVQLVALEAIDSFCKAWPDHVALSSSFFPGFISSLARLLSPKPSDKTFYKPLVAGLEFLSKLLVSVLGDDKTKSLPERTQGEGSSKALDQVWLRATVGQVKIALSNVMKLRTRNHVQVRRALAHLCLTCLKNCWISLEPARDMLLESALVVAANDEQIATDLEHFMVINESIAEILRSILYNSVVSLPRLMLSADDTLRQRTLNQISLNFRLLSDGGMDLSMVENVLAASVRDSIVNVFSSQKTSTLISEQNQPSSMEIATLSESKETSMPDVVATSGTQKQIVLEMSRMMTQLATNDQSFQLTRQLVASLRSHDEKTRLASLWASLQLLRAASESSLSDMLNIDGIDDGLQDLLEETYDFALQMLNISDYETKDWRIRALSLEVVTLQAHFHGEGFRSEFIDCLYPVVQTMGSSIPELRQHAVVALNLLAGDCGYHSSGEMIIDNVDYLVNAVALRLNTFDLSPQAPQVLVMMIRLAGSPLLPFLDDIVESIFAALESFHGYPKLVGFLFEVLNTIAQEGVKSPGLQIEEDMNLLKQAMILQRPISVANLCLLLSEQHSRLEEQELVFDSQDENIKEALEAGEYVGFHNANKSKPSENSPENDTLEKSSDSKELKEGGSLPKDQAKTYELLLSIARLTQHYLTTSSLELRIKLLTLLKTIFPTLGRLEDSFLPLINVLWPVLLPRLHDLETFVVAGALDAITLLCVHAGSFMKSRIEDAWLDIRALHARCWPTHPRTYPKLALDQSQESPTFGFKVEGFTQVPGAGISASSLRPSSHSPATGIRNSLVDLLIAITKHIKVNDSMLDDLFEMLLPMAKANQSVHNVLESANPDALWLAFSRLHSPI